MLNFIYVMEKVILKDCSNPYWSEFLELYEGAFPAYERRTQESLKKSLQEREFEMQLFLQGGELVGLLGLWRFDGVIFLEYLAVASQLRGGGLGTKILREFFKSVKSEICVLEIDIPQDEISQKRLRFYKKCGFFETVYKSVQQYLKKDNGQIMNLLSFPHEMTPYEYKKFARFHKNIVLNPQILYC